MDHSEIVERACTCHPSEAPYPCQRKYAFTDCKIAALESEIERHAGTIFDQHKKIERLRDECKDRDHWRQEAEQWRQTANVHKEEIERLRLTEQELRVRFADSQDEIERLRAALDAAMGCIKGIW